MILPEDDKDSVRRMIQWLYSRKLGLKRPVSDETSDECYMQLAKLNTLADKYDIYLLKNDIVDELFHLQKPPRDFKPPPTSVVAYILQQHHPDVVFPEADGCLVCPPHRF